MTRWRGVAALAAMMVSSSLSAQADTSTFARALQLESDGKYKEAAPLYRVSLKGPDTQSAFLGLERVYAELGWTDSLLAPLDSLIKTAPADPIYRTSQLRSLQTLGREPDLRRAFQDWTKAAANDPAPYREYARLLIQSNRAAAADSIVADGQKALGSIRGMEMEVAQVRAASGDWLESARAWRAALAFSPDLDEAAAYSLTPTPSAKRDSIRAIFLAPPISAPPRLAVAKLEGNWGSPDNGWKALRELPPDSASVDAWIAFADRAEGDGQWPQARDALIQAVKARPSSPLSLRAANDAMNAGDGNMALALAPLSSAGNDSAKIARLYIPLHVRALASLGKIEEAQALSSAFDHWFVPAAKSSVTRTIAWGWVRRGDMEHARQALAAVGAEGDSSDTAGWLALYEGDIKTARHLLRAGTETTPELALALGTVARIKTDRAPEVGTAFLALARGDTLAAATAFVAAADRTPDAASTLLLIAGQLRQALRDDPSAIALWNRIVDQYPESAEAPEAELAWAGALLRKKDAAAAVTRLEHLILTYPQSALLPQARRELDVARRAVPPEVL